MCTECGRKGHNVDECWSLLGYLKWNSKHKRGVNQRRNYQHKSNKSTNYVQQSDNDSEDHNHMQFTAKQLEQLIKMLPINIVKSEEQNELESPFSRIVQFNIVLKILPQDNGLLTLELQMMTHQLWHC